MGGISRYSGGVFVEGACKHCFSLIMYEFCSSNAPYSASLPFIMFIECLGGRKKNKKRGWPYWGLRDCPQKGGFKPSAHDGLTIGGDIFLQALNISVARTCRFLICIGTDLSTSSSSLKEDFFHNKHLSCSLFILLVMVLL